MMIDNMLGKNRNFILIGGHFFVNEPKGKVSVISQKESGEKEVIHISRRKGKNKYFEKEFKNLEFLNEKKIKNIPRNNVLKNIDGFSVLSSSYISGATFSNILVKDNSKLDSQLDSIFSWLQKFQKRVSSKKIYKESWVVEVFKKMDGLNFSGEDKKNILRSVPDSFNSTYCHGDFGPKNVLMEVDTISGVVDWESAHEGPIYEDPLYFCFRLSWWGLKDKNWVEAVRLGFFQENEKFVIINSILGKYYPELSKKERLVFLCLGLINRAYEEFLRTGQKNNEPKKAASYIFEGGNL